MTCVQIMKQWKTNPTQTEGHPKIGVPYVAWSCFLTRITEGNQRLCKVGISHSRFSADLGWAIKDWRPQKGSQYFLAHL